jgi:hypothetical protein
MKQAPEKPDEDAVTPNLSRIKRRLLDAALDIQQEEPEEFTFQHSVLCQTALPSAKPSADTLLWERRQGRATLLVEAGKALNPRTGHFVQLGLPYGPKARLLLMHLNSEAVRQRSPVIPVEDSMTAFFRRIMGRTQDGRQANMLKAQLSALAAATFRLGITDGERAMQMDAKVVGAFELWLPREPGQQVLWPSVLRLSLDYYDSLTKYAVPLDERAVAALAHSALALDTYCWLAQRLHRIARGKPQFVPWPALQEQLGEHYGRTRDFRRDFLNVLKQVKVAYPEAMLDADRKGLCLWESPPPVRKRFITLSGGKLLDLKAE